MKRLIVIAFMLLAIVACKDEGNQNPKPEPVKPKMLVDFGEEVVKNARTYLHVNETEGPNRSPEIDKFHDYAGLPYGNPWCLMFVNYNWYEVLNPYGYEPYTKTARVSYLLQYALKHKLLYDIKFDKALLYGVKQAEPGDMLIWVKGIGNTAEDNFNGHTGFVQKEIEPGKFLTIEGNTGPGNSGSQRDGDGVYERTRTIRLGADFRIEALIKPIYPDTEKK
jgi:hypothetical protein